MNQVGTLIDSIEKIIKGKRDIIELVVTSLLAKGHILLEDNPGAGKTVLAKTLAGSISSNDLDAQQHHLNFKRVQFTPDLLPMDLLGSHIYDDARKDFIFKKGPLFTNILLADEINRASPKVQSALLECMAENQISVGDKTYQLERLFFTIATQNPIESEGTYPLPHAQLDRFFMKLSLGYVTEEVEMDIYRNYLAINNIDAQVQQVLTAQDILDLQHKADNTYVDEEILVSVKNIVFATRRHAEVHVGASTRSGIIFIKCLKAHAVVQGRDYVIEDDIQALAEAVFNHRLLFKNKEAKQTVLKSIVAKEVDRLAKLKILQGKAL